MMNPPGDGELVGLASAVDALDRGELTRDGFLAALRTTLLIVPMLDDETRGATFVVFRYGSHECGAVFSSDELVPTQLSGYRRALLTGEALAKQWPSGLVLALDSSDDGPGLLVPGDQVQRMASDRLDRVIPAGERLLIGAPAVDPPEDLRRAAAELVVAFDQVESTYLFQMATGDDSRLILGVVLAPGTDPQRVMPSAAGWIADRAPQPQPVDLLPLTGSMLKSVQEFVAPTA